MPIGSIRTTAPSNYIEHADEKAETTIPALFSKGYAAMATVAMELLESPELRNMPQEYGIVPIPKYSESQTTYYSQMHNGFCIASIPNTISEDRAEMIGAVLEAMASTSYHIVRPVYYETVLRTQLAKDPQSAEMIDLIVNNIHIDIEFSYSEELGYFHSHFRTIVKKGRIDGLVSKFESASTATKKSLQRLIAKLDRLAE